MRTDGEILFLRIKDVALKFPQSPRFQRWLREKVGSKDIHHCFKSVHGRKSTNLLSVGADHLEHIENQHNNEWLIAQVPKAIENLLEYTTHLEQLLKEKKK